MEAMDFEYTIDIFSDDCMYFEIVDVAYDDEWMSDVKYSENTFDYSGFTSCNYVSNFPKTFNFAAPTFNFSALTTNQTTNSFNFSKVEKNNVTIF